MAAHLFVVVERGKGKIPEELRKSIDYASVAEAVELKAKYPFAYADAFVAALAIRLRVPLVTGNRACRALEADGLLTLRWAGA